MLLFAVLTVILTGAIVWGGRVGWKHYETLTFAADNPNGDEARFAAKLATVLKNNSSRLRLKIVTNADNARRSRGSSAARPISPCCAPTPGCRRARGRSRSWSTIWCF